MVVFRVLHNGKESFVTAAGYTYDPRERSATFYEKGETGSEKAFYNNVEAIERYGKAPSGTEALPVVWIANRPEAEVLPEAEALPAERIREEIEIESAAPGSGS